MELGLVFDKYFPFTSVVCLIKTPGHFDIKFLESTLNIPELAQSQNTKMKVPGSLS